MISIQQIALWADKLRDISALGLHFSDSFYDREHYTTVQNVAMAMLAAASGQTVEELEPLRSLVLSHPTPFSVGDGAVIGEKGELLLVRRADNRKWAMPGGALEVGETPAEGVAREVLEETGVKCEPVALVGVFDSRLCGSLTRHHLYHFVFLCRPLLVQEPSTASHVHEVVEVGWFTEDKLPPDIDPGHVTRIPEAFRVWRGNATTFFDRCL